MNDTSNDSEPLVPADAPDDYIVGYEIDGTPIILKDFLEQADKSVDECKRGYYYKPEDLNAKYEAYFKYLKNNPDSKLSPKEFEKKFPEYSPVLYHGPRNFQLEKVSSHCDPKMLGGFIHISTFKANKDTIDLGAD